MLKSTEKQRHYCCVCSNYTGKFVNEQTIQLHRFPAKAELRRAWLRRIKLVYGSYTNSPNDRLCSYHFLGGRKTIINAIPSIFDNKTFKTSTLSSAHLNDDVLNGNAGEENAVENDAVEGTSFVTKECSAVCVSVMLNDYCGQVKLDSICKYVNKNEQTNTVVLVDSSAQTDIQTQSIGVQTDFVCDASNSLTRQDKGVNIVKHVGLQATKPDMTIEDICHSDDKMMFYSGIPNSGTFYLLFDEMDDIYPENKMDCSSGRPRNLRTVDEFLMVLMRLRLGLLLEDLAGRFKISKGSCSTIVSRWVDYLHLKLAFLLVWPTKVVNRATMPRQFKIKYPNCRVIIDCTELFTQTPQSLANKSLMYSSYKSHMTYKALLGINPQGIITFVSNLWSGSMSDKQLTKRCGILDLCQKGDSIMADKGFLISDLTTPRGIRLIIPPLKYARFTRRQVEETRRIANLRIHVERAMERVKNFRILQGDIPITLSSQVSKLWKICACLSNLQPPLVTDN